MEQHRQLLTEYQHVLTLSEQLLSLAILGQWDELVELEIVYLKAMERIMPLPASLPGPAQQFILRQTIDAILHNIGEVKRLLQLRMEVLKQRLEQHRCQREVNAAYGQCTEQAWSLGNLQ